MNSTQVSNETAIKTPRARTVDMKLEVVVIPVSDVDRAKRFYGNLGWRLDADFVRGDEFRVVESRLQTRRARSTSARESRRPCRARHREITHSRHRAGGSAAARVSSSAQRASWHRHCRLLHRPRREVQLKRRRA